MSAIEAWERLVRAHHNQSISKQESYDPLSDFWRPFTSFFHADPRRTDDMVLERLIEKVKPEETVLDVGGGGGRFALPLALNCRHVTVVEPSESMLAVLQDVASETGIENLSIVQSSWEEAKVKCADVVLCAHVVYGVEEIGTFVRKLTAYSRRLVLLMMMMEWPLSGLSSAWRLVHNEERMLLPGVKEMLPVLWEMDIYPDLEMGPPISPRTFETREKAREELRRRMYVKEGSSGDKRLFNALSQLLVEVPGGYTIRGAPLRRLAFLSWKSE
jgi:SAM-dependent methyltransferase